MSNGTVEEKWKKAFIDFRGTIFAEETKENINKIKTLLNRTYYGLQKGEITYNLIPSSDYPGFYVHGDFYKISNSEVYSIHFIYEMEKNKSCNPLLLHILKYYSKNEAFEDFFIYHKKIKNHWNNLEGEKCKVCENNRWNVEIDSNNTDFSSEKRARAFLTACCTNSNTVHSEKIILNYMKELLEKGIVKTPR
ncbi:MAG: hypothetical protein LBU83_12510 [Bacteroidales bacterium]|jgi:hypothetical protein|nr:hypothetical protein [Bacteroidales bacterium]